MSFSAGYPNNAKNPVFEKNTFKAFIPEFAAFVDGAVGTILYDKFSVNADDDINIGTYYNDWENATSLYIAHNIQLINMRREKSYSTGDVAKESLTGLKVDEIYRYQTAENDTALWWNQTEYGKQLYNLTQKYNVATFVISQGG